MLCVFDVNETLLDLAALDNFFADLTGDPSARRDWFDLMIHNALALTAARSYQPFGKIAAACLPAIAATRGRTATPDDQRELGERLRRLPAHPEVHEAITRLRAAGFGVVTLTNSVATVAEDQLCNAGLRPLVDAVYSADQVGHLKPAPEPYQLVLVRGLTHDGYPATKTPQGSRAAPDGKRIGQLSTVTEPPGERDPATPGHTEPEVLTIQAAAELPDARVATETFAPAWDVPAGAAVVIGLSAVTYLSLEAVVPLVTLAHRREARGGTLRISTSPESHRKLTLLGLDTVLTLHPAG
jgi:2-haloacid dehalogenase